MSAKPKAAVKPLVSPAKLKTAIIRTLDKIGKQNGTALPDDVSSADALLYELYVSAEGSSHFKRRYDEAKAAINEQYEHSIEAILEGESSILETGDLLTLTGQKRRASERVDQTAFKSALRRAGVSQDVINQAEKDAKKKGKPALVLTASFASTP